MLDGLAIAIVVTKGWAKGYIYTALTRPFTCRAIAWSFARLAIDSLYVYGLLAQLVARLSCGEILKWFLMSFLHFTSFQHRNILHYLLHLRVRTVPKRHVGSAMVNVTFNLVTFVRLPFLFCFVLFCFVLFLCLFVCLFVVCFCLFDCLFVSYNEKWKWLIF